MLRGRVDMQPTGPDSVQARFGVEMKQYLEVLEGEREQMTGAQVLDAVVELVMEPFLWFRRETLTAQFSNR
jgi:hypothetical protein